MGESTAKARMNLLKEHAAGVKKRIAEEKLHLKKINAKIAFYEKMISVITSYSIHYTKLYEIHMEWQLVL